MTNPTTINGSLLHFRKPLIVGEAPVEDGAEPFPWRSKRIDKNTKEFKLYTLPSTRELFSLAFDDKRVQNVTNSEAKLLREQLLCKAELYNLLPVQNPTTNFDSQAAKMKLEELISSAKSYSPSKEQTSTIAREPLFYGRWVFLLGRAGEALDLLDSKPRQYSVINTRKENSHSLFLSLNRPSQIQSAKIECGQVFATVGIIALYHPRYTLYDKNKDTKIDGKHRKFNREVMQSIMSGDLEACMPKILRGELSAPLPRHG